MYADILSSSDSEPEDEPVQRVDNKFVHVSSDEEDTKRIVKSARDKRCIAELEDFVNDSWEKKKDLNKGAVKSLATLKQRVKKYTRLFETNIRDFREEDNSDHAHETTFVKVPQASAIVSKKANKSLDLTDSEDEDDSDDFSDDDTSSLSSFDLNMENYKGNLSAYFLKDTSEDKKDKTKVKKVSKDKITKKRLRTTVEDVDEEGAWTTIDTFGRTDVQMQAFEKGQEINHEIVFKKILEIVASRGKKGTSINEQLILLLQVEDKIKEHQLSPGLHVKLLLSLISVIFDYDKKHADCMSNTTFERALNAFDRLFALLNEIQIEFILSEASADEDEILETSPYYLKGSLVTMVGLLDTECFKVLQNANGHELEYVDRLRDERRVCTIIHNLCDYLEKHKALPDSLCISYLYQLEHLYYKFDFEWARKVEASSLSEVGTNPNTLIIQRLCEYIYSNDRTDRSRTRAILCHIYHLALYNNWFKARDLMLMSNLQMTIEHADQSTMILYNRAMVQLGLCAFRAGYIRDAHNALADMIGSNRIRELLAQGLHTQTRYERTTEEEKRERALQMPYHMYINIDLLECIYLVSAMLLEIPTLAAHETDFRWRPISKPFHLALRVHDRAALVGPPESARDFVLAAAKAMRCGNWRSCTDYIINPKMDAKIWNLLFESHRVKKHLELKIKEESLRSSLFIYSAIHDSINLDRLAEYFELPKSSVYSIICKMIINQELAASLEVPTDALIMHKTERSRLQALALQLSDKVNSIVEMNDKLIESRGGGLSGLKGSQAHQGPRRQGFRYTLNKF